MGQKTEEAGGRRGVLADKTQIISTEQELTFDPWNRSVNVGPQIAIPLVL